MYRAAFGFNRDPFDQPRDGDELFRTPLLDELHSRLGYLVQHRALGLLTGEPGTGKSTALRRLRDELHPEKVRSLYLCDTTVSVNDFCRHLALGLGLEPAWSRARTFRDLQGEILRLTDEQRLTVLVVIDEAHGLRSDVLTLLTRLTNFGWDAAPRLSLLLAGLTGLRQRLRMAYHEALEQRITVRFALSGLDRDHTRGYLEHRLRCAGVDRPLFTQPASEALFTISRGIPRRIDAVAHHALAAAAAAGARLVEPDHVLAAAEETRS